MKGESVYVQLAGWFRYAGRRQRLMNTKVART